MEQTLKEIIFLEKKMKNQERCTSQRFNKIHLTKIQFFFNIFVLQNFAQL